MRRPIAAMLAAVAVGGLGACGGTAGAPAAKAPKTTAATPSRPRPATPSSPTVPAPKPAPGKVDADSARVIRGYLAALRNGDLAGAAAFFGQPAKVSNASPVLTLRSRGDRVGFMATFPCGAKAAKLSTGERGFTLVTFQLTERKGGDCQGASGNKAYGAIRVSRGRIVEWYRLPDAPDSTQPSPLDGSSAPTV